MGRRRSIDRLLRGKGNCTRIEVESSLIPVCMMVADRETHSFKLIWLCAPNAPLLDELAKLALTGERDAIAKGV